MTDHPFSYASAGTTKRSRRDRECVLAVGAHPDDVELGCGATLRAHVVAGDRVVMLVMSEGQRGPGGDDGIRRAEQVKAARTLGVELRWGGQLDCMIGDGPEAVAAVETVIAQISPTVVYTHAPHDSHQDHRATSRAVESAAREVASVMFFESPSSLDFTPNVYVDIDDFVEDKLAALEAHQSQVHGSSKVDPETVRALLRVRGFQARVRNAEGFCSRRFVVNRSPDEGFALLPGSGHGVERTARNTSGEVLAS